MLLLKSFDLLQHLEAELKKKKGGWEFQKTSPVAARSDAEHKPLATQRLE